MSDVRIKINSGAVREILRSGAMEADLRKRAERIASKAGEGMVATSTIGRARALAKVHTETTEAKVAEATERALTRAIDAGR